LPGLSPVREIEPAGLSRPLPKRPDERLPELRAVISPAFTTVACRACACPSGVRTAERNLERKRAIESDDENIGDVLAGLHHVADGVRSFPAAHADPLP
jgi:hypothetical protein